ncbi:MAG: cupin domain-containing protein [Proteobacteria bacterium]|nr:cupin domain-containing protein [Pseudomonadota bacterium]
MSQGLNDPIELTEVVHAAGLVDIQPGGVVSRTIVKKKTGTVTVFAFDAGEGLSEHTTPFEALVINLEGEAKISIAGVPHRLQKGDLLKLTAGLPHAVKAITPFKMLIIMIRE